MPVLSVADNPHKCVLAGRTMRTFTQLVGRLRRSKQLRKNRQWLVAQTKPNQERVLAHALTRRRLTYYLPMQPAEIRSGNSIKKGMRLALPGLVFMYGTPECKYIAQETRRVWGFIDVRDTVLLESDLLKLDRMLRAAKLADTFKSLQPGQRVRIVSGVMNGIEANIVDTNKTKMTVNLDIAFLGSVSFEIGYEKLRRVK